MKLKYHCIQPYSHIWLPHDCRSLNVAVVSNTVPIDLWWTLPSSYELYILLYTLRFKFSAINCSQRYFCWDELRSDEMSLDCSAHFNLGIGSIGVSKFRSLECLDFCYNRIDTESVVRANILREVLMIRDGLLEFSNDLFEVYDLDDFVNLLVR